ncbi:hypothetical protein KQR54_26585 [Mycobacterium gordonae]|uniref:hypothetical protein n=1 Tax=Mycobacterium gordonae TaxID=1778 RepID=UPI00210A7CCD|nr:hypothetical protein [Mycobacterium gordonae]MCQ4364650.1 hypothetical protein [Mycobacterium gordonae]
MTISSELVPVNLTESERKFTRQALHEWQNTAAWKPFPIQVLGLSAWSEFDELTDRLAQAVTGCQSLSVLDWARVLYLTECSWASSFVGAALDFSTVSGSTDTEALGLLRGLQRKMGGMTYTDALFPGRGRPRPVEEWKRESEKIIEERRARRYPPGL